MWKKVKIEEVDFLIKHTVHVTSHKLSITDLINMWYEDIEEDILLQRCKEMNKLVEASDGVFLGHVLSLIESEEDDIIRSFSDTDSKKVLSLHTSLEGFKFRLKFLMKPASNIQFYEEVTRPLLTAVSELEKRQQQLVEVIKSKDMEILEYKLEGGQISRKAVETTQFDLDVFSVKCAEGLSNTKSSVTSERFNALTPFVQDLLEKISVAPEVTISKPLEEERQNSTNISIIKFKSPSKSKKLKMYIDDTEEKGDMETDNSKKEEDILKKEEIKVKEEDQPETKRAKGKQKPKQKKLLPNL